MILSHNYNKNKTKTSVNKESSYVYNKLHYDTVLVSFLLSKKYVNYYVKYEKFTIVMTSSFIFSTVSVYYTTKRCVPITEVAITK